MTANGQPFPRRYLQMAGVGLASAGVAAALGYVPTVRLGGESAVAAMLVGCGIAILAGWIGVIPACLPGTAGAALINRVLGATALRMVVAVVLTLAVVLADWLATKPLVLWVAISYIFTLAGETVVLVRWVNQERSPDGR